MTLIEQRRADTNFAHTCHLLGPIAAWAEDLKVGHVLEHDDLNMITIPVEIALAFLDEHLGAEGELGDAARKARELFAGFRSAAKRRAKPRKTRRRKPASTGAAL